MISAGSAVSDSRTAPRTDCAASRFCGGAIGPSGMRGRAWPLVVRSGALIGADRVYPQPRSGKIAEHAAGIAWKLQGANPLGNVLVVVSLNLLDPVLDAMEQPQEQPRRRRNRRQVELLNPKVGA